MSMRKPSVPVVTKSGSATMIVFAKVQRNPQLFVIAPCQMKGPIPFLFGV